MLRKQMESLVSEMLDGRIMLDEAVAEFEKLYIQQALERNNKHLSKTAAAIGIHRNTISKRLAEYENDGKKPAQKSSTRVPPTTRRKTPANHVNKRGK